MVIVVNKIDDFYGVYIIEGVERKEKMDVQIYNVFVGIKCCGEK